MTEHPHPGFSDFHLHYFFSSFLVNSFHRMYFIKEENVLSPPKGLCHQQADEQNIFWYKGPSKHSCKLTIFVTDYLDYMEI